MGTLRGRATDEPDPVAVQLCIRGDLPAHLLTTAERVEVVRELTRLRLSDGAIAKRTCWGTRGAVCRFRRTHRIPAGVRCPPRRQAGQRPDWWHDPATKEQRVRELTAAGMSDAMIGRTAGVAAETVSHYRWRLDIPSGQSQRPRRRA